MKRGVKYFTGFRIFSGARSSGPGKDLPVPSAPHPSSFILHPSPPVPHPSSLIPHPSPTRPGITLVEMMISIAIMSIGLLGMIGSFKYLNVGIQTAKQKSLANNIAQEKMAQIKNKSYYRVLVTTATEDDTNFSPTLVYDTAPNGTESITVGGITFERGVYIRKVSEDASGDLDYYSWNAPDTGLKEVAVYVVWQERGAWKKLELRNLVENPDRTNLSSTFSGRVRDAATEANLEGAVVRAQENPTQYGETDVSGNYSFPIEPGSYTLMASMEGYFALIRPQTSIVAAETKSGQDFALVKMSSGNIRGHAFKRDHMVIYMVVASSAMANGDEVEFVSLYNPTTAQINMLTNPAVSTSNNIKLSYYGEAGASQDVPEIWLQHRSTFIPSGYHYLIASTGTFSYGGINITADAVYAAANSPACSPVGAQLNCIRRDKAGAIRISNVDNNVLDTLGWSRTDAGKDAPYYEGTAYPLAAGIPEGAQFFRRTTATGETEYTGSCYDSDTNNSNFLYYAAPAYRTMTEAHGYKAPVTGTPVAGAMVFANDTLSAPVLVNTTGWYVLPSVATGTWTVYITTGAIFTSSGTFRVASDGSNAVTPDLIVGTATLYGYVTGTVTGVTGSPLNNIKLYSSGTPEAATNSSGRYTLPALAGVTTVVANYMNQSPTYLEYSSMNVIVSLGQVTPNVDFTLSYGGKIRGLVTTNGVDPLPNVPAVAFKNGVEQGYGISGADGYFTVSGAGISTGTYEVSLQLDAGESSSPSSSTIVLSAGQVAFSSTYTVSGAYGYIAGRTTTGSAGGPAITTGVLIYATTTTITSTPPAINSATRSGTAVYYGGSSNAMGEYTIPVRGGYTYNLYAWYTTWSGNTPTVTRKEYIGANAFTVAPNGTVTKNFFW